jgi:CheY-like chemotaxis protein
VPTNALPPAAVLVVVHEPAANRVIGRYLAHLGYRVLEAGSSEEALAILRRTSPRVDLVLSDVLLRGTSGPELAATILTDCPAPSVVLMSGRIRDEVERTSVRGQIVRVLRKPLNLDQLQELFRAMLDGFPAESEPESVYLAGWFAPSTIELAGDPVAPAGSRDADDLPALR